MQRDQSIEQLQEKQTRFDLVVVGGGATGLGIAVDAATRGHQVALLERDDFAKGTSSRSTKLVHGGVRYLRQGNLSLVLDALRERGRMARNAPHLVHEQAFVIPAYQRWEGLFYGIGMKLYDYLAGSRGWQRSRRLTRGETLRLLPTLESQNLAGGVLYHDGQFDDARYAIHLARTAASHGAVLANYVEVVGLQNQGGRTTGVQVRDRESGRDWTVGARVVVNATGVFVDEIRRKDEPAASPLITVSQGVHLVLPRKFLPGDTALMVPKTSDGRVLFAIPWQGVVIVGTTDTAVPKPSTEPRALEEECTFLLEHIRHFLADDPVDSDVLCVFAGLRPLVSKGSKTKTSSISRDHTISTSKSGLVTITGGKWTTYRKMAEEVVCRAEIVGGLQPRPCATHNLRLHGWTEDAEAGFPMGVYGADATSIKALATASPSLARPLHPRLPYLSAEVVWHVRKEMARTIEDVLARRTRALVLDARASIEAAPIVAELLAIELNRDSNWREEQIARYTRMADGYVFLNRASRSKPHRHVAPDK